MISITPALFNCIGSDNQTQNSIIGVNGSRMGGSYSPGKYGGGFLSDAINEHIEFTYTPNSSTGTYSLWFKPNFSSADTTTRYIVDRSGLGVRFAIIWVNWRGSFGWGYVVPPGNVLGESYDNITGDSHSAGDDIYIKLTWNTAGIAGSSDTVRFYINGVLKLTSTAAVPTTTAQTNIQLGSDTTALNPSNGVIDEFKVYEVENTNSSDRFICGIGVKRRRST